MKNQENNVETITIEQRMSVEELEKSTKKLVEIVTEMKKIEEEQKDINKEFNDRKKSLKEILGIKAEECLTAIRKTEINVTKRANITTCEYEYSDIETGVIVKREPFLLPPAPLFDGSIEDVIAIFENEETGVFEEEEGLVFVDAEDVEVDESVLI